MNRKSVFLGCVILTMAAISAASAQGGSAATNVSTVSSAATSTNASLNDTSDESGQAQNQAAISAEKKTAAECNISIPATSNTCIMPTSITLGSKNKIASFRKPAFVIGGGGDNMMQRANEVMLPAETIMDLSWAINIKSSQKPLDMGIDRKQLLQLASDVNLSAETIMDLSANVLPRYKIRNIN